jgi:PAS domain S-box-containing protein
MGINDIKREVDKLKGNRKYFIYKEYASKGIHFSEKIFTTVSDADRFLYINPAFKTRLGYSYSIIDEMPIVQFIHKDDQRATRNMQQLMLDGKSVAENFCNRYYTKNLDVIYIEWLENILVDGLWISTAIEVTEERYLECKEKYNELWLMRN